MITLLQLLVASRLLVVVSAVTDLFLLLALITGWKRRSAAYRFIWSGLVVVLLAIVYGALVSTWATALALPQTVLLLVGLVYVGLGLLAVRRDQRDISKLE